MTADLVVSRHDDDVPLPLEDAGTPAPPLRVDIGRPSPDTTLVHLIGDLDLATRPLLVASLEHVLANEPRQVILVLARVEFLAACGLSALCDAHAHATEVGSTLVLASPTPMITRILAITGVDRSLPVYPTLGAALQAELVSSLP